MAQDATPTPSQAPTSTAGGATTTSADVANANALNEALNTVRNQLSTNNTAIITAVNNIATAITQKLLGGVVGTTTNILLKSKTVSSGSSAGSLQASGITCDASNNLTGILGLTATGTGSFHDLALTNPLPVADGGTGVTTVAGILALLGIPFALTTVQRFTSGSGNYTPTANVTKIRVRMCGGGGGGGAQVTNPGSNGGDTSFGSWTALHGNGGGQGTGVAGNPSTGGAGGSGGAAGTGNLIVRISGEQGRSGNAAFNANVGLAGGDGGANPFAGTGIGGFNNAAGNNAVANTGAGGGGAANSNNATGAGAGGGSGEYVEFWVNAPGTIAYAIGGGGNGGAAGTKAGGNGAAGVIVIEEFYW